MLTNHYAGQAIVMSQPLTSMLQCESYGMLELTGAWVVAGQGVCHSHKDNIPFDVHIQSYGEILHYSV